MQPDDQYDLKRLLGMDNHQAPQGQIILPNAGVVCPHCGFEPKRLPDGSTSDSMYFTLEGVQSPLFHTLCVNGAIAARDAAYIVANVKPWEPKNPKGEDANVEG